MEKVVENKNPHFETNKTTFDQMQQSKSISLITYEGERKYNLFYTLEKTVKYIGTFTIMFILINGLSYLINNKLIMSWKIVVLIPVVFMLIEFIKGDLSCPAYKVVLDLEKRIIHLKYTYNFIFTREYQSSFNDIKFNFSNKINGSIEKVSILNSKNDTICYIDSREGIFSDESFNQIVKIIDELTFYKNKK